MRYLYLLPTKQHMHIVSIVTAGHINIYIYANYNLPISFWTYFLRVFHFGCPSLVERVELGNRKGWFWLRTQLCHAHPHVDF